MAMVFKVSKEGKDVNTVAGKDLVYSSEYNSPKISSQGTSAITNNLYSGTPALVNIPHNLGYTPSYALYFRPSSSGKWHSHRGRYNFDGTAFSDIVDWWAEVGTANLSVYSIGDTSRTHDIYYFILADGGI